MQKLTHKMSDFGQVAEEGEEYQDTEYCHKSFSQSSHKESIYLKLSNLVLCLPALQLQIKL